jgi:hypothetical protein
MCYSYFDTHTGSNDSSAGTVTRQWAGWSWVWFLVQESLSLLQNVQNDAAAHQASHSMGSGGSFTGGKAAKTWSWPLSPILCSGYERVKLCSHTSTACTGQLHLYVLHEIYDISCVPALTYLNWRYKWQKLFCKYNEFNYQSLKECWIIWLTNLLSLTDNKIMGVLSLMSLHMCIWNSFTHPFTALYYRTGWLSAVTTWYRVIILSD